MKAAVGVPLSFVKFPLTAKEKRGATGQEEEEYPASGGRDAADGGGEGLAEYAVLALANPQHRIEILHLD